MSLCLALKGVAVASSGNSETRSGTHLEDMFYGGGYIGDRFWVEDRRWRVVVYVAEIGGSIMGVF